MSSSGSLHFQDGALLRPAAPCIPVGGSRQPPALLPGSALLGAHLGPSYWLGACLYSLCPLLLPSLTSPCQAAWAPRVADPSRCVWQARSERTDIATLLIPAITAADAGFYLCVATSPAGTAQARIQVVVLPGAGPWG